MKKISPPGAGANQDPKLRLIRKATSNASSRFGVGGRIKTRNAPKRRPISLPPVNLPPVKEGE